MMLERVYEACITFPARRAFVIRNEPHTYEAFAARVAAIVRLLEREAPAEPRVAILTHDDLDTYASVFAAWFSGKAMVPLAPTSPPDRNSSILHLADVSVALSSRQDLAQLESTGVRWHVTSGVPSDGSPLHPRTTRADEVAYILFTSGSTGVPKGVPITHGALDAFIDGFFALGYRLDEDDRFLQMFDLTFDLSLMSYCVPLTLGASVFTVPGDIVKYMAVYQVLEDHAITCALLVPSILAHLRGFFDEIKLEAMRYSLFCGEALYADLADEWSRCLPNGRIDNVYGPTEATIFCTAYEWKRGVVNASSNGIASIGKPMKHTGVLIVDESLEPVRPGDKGELCLSGRQLTKGYWRNPEKDRAAFFLHDGVPHYRTGDLCVAGDDGNIFYLGRLDHQVKIQGYRVELSEIEHHARELSGVKHLAAVACQDAAKNVVIHLFLEKYDRDLNALVEQLKARLPSYMIPTHTRSIDALPLNANGKIDRPALVRSALVR
jgi:D-alanine--poly(phosphoribitol) ligase subunit 1